MIETLTAAAAAAATTTALTGYLSAGATKVAEATGEAAVEQGKRLVGWLRGHLAGPAKEALADLRTEPSEATAVAFRTELERSLDADPTLLQGLRGLLAEMPDAIRFGEQNANFTGDRNKVGQAQGQNIRISIR